MARITVPQEQAEEIIRLYQDEKMGKQRIVKVMNLPFSEDVVNRILRENNIHIRGIQEAHKFTEWPELRKFPVNDDYCLESHNGAWLLGFIAADGYLPITRGARNRIVISLQEKDRECLEDIAEEINFHGKIKRYQSPDKIHYFCSLAFASKKLRAQIENYGIVNAKTFKLSHIPSLPEPYKLDFIRGFWDGDGSIYKASSGKICMSLTCASRQLLSEINQYLTDSFGVGVKNVHKDHNNAVIRYCLKETLVLGDAFYNNSYLALPRKRRKYFEILNSL